jgi:hypothetical protein
MPNISSRLRHPQPSTQHGSLLADSLYSSDGDNESTHSTLHAHGHESPVMRPNLEGRLTISNERDGRLYEWFQITERTIDGITLEIFSKYVNEFFGIPIDSLVVRDIDGPIESTADLRRSLRSHFPTLSVSERGGRSWLQETCSEQDCPQTCPIPYKSPTVRVLLTKIPGVNSLGFSNMASACSVGLVVTRITPGGLLSQAVPKIRVGDTIESVNKVSGDLDRMRRELLMSDRLVLDVSLTSFNMAV